MSDQINRVMFDTNVFNRIVDSDIDVTSLPASCEYYVTSLQHSELRKTQNLSRRKRLLSAFCELVWKRNTAESDIKSTPWGVPWGSPWNSGTGIYDEIRRRLDQNPQSKSKRGNKFDALIIEVCREEGFTLVSEDLAVREVARDYGVSVFALGEFLKVFPP
jgi:rRNA-processing protein FCF1